MKEDINITGIILTGGKSSRMGQDKAFMDVGGVPVFKRILNVFGEIFDEVLIITNKEGRFASCGYPEVVDIIPEKGPLGGIYTGLSYAKSGSIFVASCDLPFIHASIVKMIIKESNMYDIVVLDIDGMLHPLHAAYSKRCVPYILERIESGSPNITRFINEVQGLTVRRIKNDELVNDDPDFRSVFNMNTQADWQEANAITKGA